MAFEYVLTFSLLGKVLVLFLCLGVLVWAWGAFLDSYEHDPGRVRAVMFLIITTITATEFGLAAHDITYDWVALVSLAITFWGSFDALLRYPAAHSIESFFTVKQFCLLIVKTFVYTFGMISIRQNIGIFLTVLLVNIWGLPVLYLMALPLDPAEQVVKDDAYDIDLAARVWQLAVCSNERRRCIATCRSWWHRNLMAASECSPLACFAICAASPEYRQKMRKQGRSV